MTIQSEGPGSGTIDEVRRIWSEVLQPAGPIGPNEDFFQLGGDSLTIMMMLFRIDETFGFELGAESLIEHSTLCKFSACVDAVRAQVAEAAGSAPPGCRAFEEGSI